MLSELSILGFAIADRLRLEFAPGLLAITGETGAGKSLLVNALAFVLGGRAQTEWIRTGSGSCDVTAVFSWPVHSGTSQLATELGADTDEPLILRRELQLSGRSRAWVNDRPATVATLRALASALCDLHGQHQHQWLLDPGTHVEVIDGWVDASCRHRYRQAYAVWDRCRAALAAEEAEIAEGAREREFWEHQLSELERVNPLAGEYEELIALRARARHAAELAELHRLTEAELAAADDSLSPRLQSLATRLDRAAAFDARLAEWALRLREAKVHIDEVATMAARSAADTDVTPDTLERLEARLHDLYRLRQKFGGDLEKAIALRAELSARLERLADSDHRQKKLRESVMQAEAELQLSASQLENARREAADRLVAAARDHLLELGLGRDPLTVRHTPLPREAWTADGSEEIEFMLAANPGEEPKPLGRVASGGELSRLMLALKSILPLGDRVGTLVFDEIDTGIGGETATKVGLRLAALAAGRQVIVITHLHQIAARADHHWSVEKRVQDGRNVPVVRVLSRRERVEVLGRLIAGGEVTPQSLAAARALVNRPGD